MKRVYSKYTDEEFGLLEKESAQIGMSISAYQKYRTLMGLRTEPYDVVKLIDEMFKALKKKQQGDRFIVSALFPPELWVTLDRSAKNTMAQALAKYVRSPEGRSKVEVIGKIYDKTTNQYQIK